MRSTAVLLLSALSASLASEGNIRLLADEIQPALVSCGSRTQDAGTSAKPDTEQRSHRPKSLLSEREMIRGVTMNRERKEDAVGKFDQVKQFRRNNGWFKENSKEVPKLDRSDDWFKSEDDGSKTDSPEYAYDNPRVPRPKRNELLRKNSDEDQCFSQCIFAYLEVVDERGIPREDLLVSRIQEAVSSHQSRTAVRDQLRSCFDELENEPEEDGCSYSNKLDGCMTLRLRDRSHNSTSATTTPALQ